MVLTTVLFAVSTVAVPVENGTWSPTCKVAGLIVQHHQRRVGQHLDVGDAVQRIENDARRILGSDQEIEAGKHAPQQRAGGGVDGVAGGLELPWCCWVVTPVMVLEIEPFWLARKNCTP